jgi:hypothetical protein
MDTFLDTKATNTQKYITQKYKQFIESFNKDVRELPPLWLDGSDELIDLVSNKLPVEECVGLWVISLNALRFVTGNDDPLGRWEFRVSRGDRGIIYDWFYLFTLAKDRRYDELDDERKNYGNLMVALGYLSIFLIAILKIQILLERNPNARDALYLNLSKILNQDRINESFVSNALETISKRVVKRYRRKTHRDPYPVERKKRQDDMNETTPEQRIYGHVFEASQDVFKVKSGKRRVSISIEEKLIKALKNEVFSVAEAVKNKLIDEYRLYDKRKSPPWGNLDNPDENNQSVESIPDIPNIHEAVKRIDLEKWIDSIKDPLDKEIATYRYKHGYTIEKIGKKVNKSIGTVHRRVKYLTPP